MLSPDAKFVGIRRCIVTDKVVFLDMALAAGGSALCYWPLADLHPDATGVCTAILDDVAEMLRLTFVLSDGETDTQRWDFAWLRQFMGVRRDSGVPPHVAVH
jgi:hypothetical protein